MKRNWMLVLLILSVVLFSGCTANTPQTDENIWVIAEQITYDENGDISNRQVYEYDGSERKYRAHFFNDDNEEYGYTDVVQTKDDTRRTETHYPANEQVGIQQTDYEYREDGKQLSQTTVNHVGNTSVKKERIWNWNDDGTVAEVLEDGVYVYTQEFDEQGRQMRSYNDEYETVFTYGEKETVLRTTFTNDTRVEYVVHKYDAQGRTIETLNYVLDEDRPYTDEDIVARTTLKYDEDGHSYTLSSVFDDGINQISGNATVIYKPLSEMLK